MQSWPRFVRIVLCSIIVAAAPGCALDHLADSEGGVIGPSGDAGLPPRDGSIVPGRDSGVVPPFSDAGMPFFPDSSVPPRQDSGGIFVPDSGGIVSDAGVVTVTCGTSVCSSGEICCIGRRGAMCTAPTACMGAALTCTGPADCTGGQLCCASLGGGGTPSASCSDPTMCQYRLCHTTADCGGRGNCMMFGGVGVCF